MSREYKEETTERVELKIQTLTDVSPEYVRAFAEFSKGKSREARTRHAYMQDIHRFLQYEIDMLPDYHDTEIADFPVDILDNLTIQDIEEYRTFLHDVRMLTNTSLKRALSSLSLFFKFLVSRDYIKKNPMEDFDAPLINKKRIIKLDSDESNTLLSGVLRNDKYKDEYYEFNGEKYKTLKKVCTAAGLNVAETKNYAAENNISLSIAINRKIKKFVTHGYEIIDIPENIRNDRDMQVLRNYAIIRLFLGAGLRVSELVGLDLNDVNWKRGSLTIIAKGGDEHEVFFGKAVHDALSDYVNGPANDYSLLEDENNAAELIEFCKKNANRTNIEELLEENHISYSPALLHNIEMTMMNMRRTGRQGFKPKRNCEALFVSKRGTRMSVSQVEKMIKEMVQTYLPDCQDKDLFSPHKLRATCATRILTQTGDISLAAEQLNHKSVAVTASFYAQLKKEKQREKIRELDTDEW